MLSVKKKWAMGGKGRGKSHQNYHWVYKCSICFQSFSLFLLIETDRQKKREVDGGEGMRRKAIYKFPLLDVKPKVYFFFLLC